MNNDKIKSLAIPAAFFAVVAAIGLWYFPHQPTTIGGVLKQWGYLEIRPAANQNGPGDIVTVDTRATDYVMLHPTCDMDRGEVSSMWLVSDAPEEGLQEALNERLKLGAELLGSIGLNGGAVSDIDVKFENTKTMMISDVSRLKLRSKYMTGECLEAVKSITAVDKLCVTQPISALQADVNYHVTFSNHINAEAKTKILGDLSGVLSMGGHAENGDQIVGKGLFVGLRLETSCIVPNDGQPGKTIETMPVSKASLAMVPVQHGVN